MFGYHSLEITHTLSINSCLGFLVGWLHYTEQGLRKSFQALRTGLLQELRNIRGSRATTIHKPRECTPDLIHLLALWVFHLLVSFPANCGWSAYSRDFARRFSSWNSHWLQLHGICSTFKVKAWIWTKSLSQSLNLGNFWAFITLWYSSK